MDWPEEITYRLRSSHAVMSWDASCFDKSLTLTEHDGYLPSRSASVHPRRRTRLSKKAFCAGVAGAQYLRLGGSLIEVTVIVDLVVSPDGALIAVGDVLPDR